MKVLNTVIQTKKVYILNHNLQGNFQLKPIYSKQIEKIDDITYSLTLNFSVENTEKEPFPIDINVSLMGIFVFSNDSIEDDIENFMQLPAAQVLFPHLRSLISSVTSSSYLQPLLLPLIDVRVFKTI